MYLLVDISFHSVFKEINDALLLCTKVQLQVRVKCILGARFSLTIVLPAVCNERKRHSQARLIVSW